MVFLAAMLTTLAAFTASAGGETPTPAPSKTATLAAVTDNSTPAPRGSSLTQADLQVLTGNVQKPNGFYYFEGMLYTACTGDATVYEINAETGATRSYIYGIRNAQTLYVEKDAENSDTLTLWVPDYQANTLNRVTRQRVDTVVTGLNGPWGLSYVDEERFLVSNLLSNSINLLTRDGENEVVMEGLAAPMGIVHDGETLYVANYGSTRRSVEWYSYDDMLSGNQDASAEHLLVSGLQNTTGLQLGSDGMLYFAYALGNRGLIGRVDPEVCRANGGCTNDQVEIVLYSDLNSPLAGLTLTPDMRMFVHTMFQPDIYWADLGTNTSS
jgi:hypothetical protein